VAHFQSNSINIIHVTMATNWRDGELVHVYQKYIYY